jgi:hypothetical protein
MLGPEYNYADELKTPSELGIGRDGSFEGIMRAVAGVNYYVDAIGFGQPTGLAKAQGRRMHQQPLGVRFFTKTGATCSNGADMYEYIDTIPKGLGGRVGNEIQKTMGVQFRGLAPGIVEDSASALDPRPFFQAVIGSGYAQCKKVTLPIGDMEGKVQSPYTKDKNGQPVRWNGEGPDGEYTLIGGKPHQTRWVFDKYISQDEYNKALKTGAASRERKERKERKEGFANPTSQRVAAGALFAVLFLGTVAWVKCRE